MLTEVSPSSSKTIPPVLLTGFLNSPLGLGQVGRALAKALEFADIPFEAFDQPLRHLQRIGSVQTIESQNYRDFPICLCSINGEHFPYLAGRVGNKFFQSRYMIGVWFWETPKLPEAARKGLPYVDEVWTCSEFTAQSIREAAPEKRIRVFPYPLLTPELNLGNTEPDYGPDFPHLDAHTFIFLFAFDYNSCLRRKNPEAVCRAFCEAFPSPLPNGPICVIKSINGDKWPVERQQFQNQFAHRPDIILYDGFLPENAMDSLLERSNCYVSLHRAEGFGLTLLEAMARGKPTIASDYSGNLTFMTHENSWLIPVELQEVGEGSRFYPAKDIWGDPDVARAALAMKECFLGGPETNAKIAIAQQEIQGIYALPRAAQAIRALLEDAATRSPAQKILPPAKSGYVRAREQLNILRDLEASLSDIKPSPWSRGMGRTVEIIRKLSRENRKTSELILKASREREEMLVARVASLEAEMADTRRRLADILKQLEQR